MPELSLTQPLLLIGGVLVATFALAGILALAMPWLTREVQAAQTAPEQTPAPPRPAAAPARAAPAREVPKREVPAREVPAAPAAPPQPIGPWPFVISGLASLVVLAVIFYPTLNLQGFAAVASTEGSASISAPAPQPEPVAIALKGDAERGKELYLSTCVACHGPEAKGVPGLGQNLTTSAFVRQQTDEQLVEFIKRGRMATDPANVTGMPMPPKGGNPALTDQDLMDIVAFLRTLNPYQP
ncbi:MAG: cytochrome c [Thermoflexus sp.]|nr:cytochrome c [Thermoflexus sp.]